MKYEWRDASNWSRGETRGTPKKWELKSPVLVVIVTRHIYYPGKWVLHTRPEIFYTMPLDSSEIEDAKEEALKFVRERLDAMMEVLR